MTQKVHATGFLQTSLSEHSRRGEVASLLLSQVANKLRDPRLSMLAHGVKLDDHDFTEVIQLIDKLVTDIEKEIKDDVKKRDYCISERNMNERKLEKQTHQEGKLQQEVEQLNSLIEDLNSKIEDAEGKIAELQTNLKSTAEARQEDSAVKQASIKDCMAAQETLKEALEVLQEVYKAKFVSKSSFAQRSSDHLPANFDPYERQYNGGKVVSVIENLMRQVKGMENEERRDEETEQKAYQEYVAKESKSMDDQKALKNEYRHQLFKSEEKKRETEESRDYLRQSKTNLEDVEAEMKKSCDFIQNNFETRQKAQKDEVAALRDAKRILSGAAVP